MTPFLVQTHVALITQRHQEEKPIKANQGHVLVRESKLVFFA